MAAIVIYIIGVFFAVFQAADTATDRGFAFVILAQILRVGEYGFQELQRNDFHAVVFYLINAGHADVLDNTQVGQVLLSECHPETCTFDCGEIFHQRLQFFVIKKVRIARTDIGVGECFVDFQRFGGYPFAVFVITSVLGNFDVDFRIEVGCKCFVMISCIAVHNV